MMNKSITQPRYTFLAMLIFEPCLFSSHAYFKVSQFWEVLVFEPCLFSRQYLLSRIYGILSSVSNGIPGNRSKQTGVEPYILFFSKHIVIIDFLKGISGYETIFQREKIL